jgi:radical SAM enzyme (TIGR01210 family)
MPRENKTSHRRSPEQAAAVWKEQEILDGKPVVAGVVILRTSGCSHYHKGGCSMCGYNYESDQSITPTSVIKQFDGAMKELGEIKFLKLYTSGSFLDECEVSKDVSKHVLKSTADNGLRLLFESRPEFATPEALREAAATNDRLEVALGLESSNDRVLKYSVNKGFTHADYEMAARSIVDAGIDVRTYVLLKPPFLTEAEAVADSKETIRYASAFSKTISLNPVNVQKGTQVERLWRNWAYRPPWLWSVLEVLRTSRSDKIRLICEPTGGGKERGAHNCGKCDDIILASIKAFSESQDQGRLGSPDCECRDVWQAVMDLDGFVMGGTTDLQRFFRPHRN